MTNSQTGYNPFFPPREGGGAYFLVNSSKGGCYDYPGGQGMMAVFPDGSAYKKDCEELRQYVIELESTRSIKDLQDVEFSRNVQKGDFLVYDNTKGKWVLTDFLSGGEF
tara:strand:- start:97 stop:423 length:327 start_codon:yes stop_codon:yes gene_type:complete